MAIEIRHSGSAAAHAIAQDERNASTEKDGVKAHRGGTGIVEGTEDKIAAKIEV